MHISERKPLVTSSMWARWYQITKTWHGTPLNQQYLSRKWFDYLTNVYLVYKYNLANNKIDSKKLSCNFHLASFYLVNSFFRQSERESSSYHLIITVTNVDFTKNFTIEVD